VQDGSSSRRASVEGRHLRLLSACSLRDEGLAREWECKGKRDSSARQGESGEDLGGGEAEDRCVRAHSLFIGGR